MESLLLMLNVLAMAVLVFTSLKNDRLKPGEEPTGPYRFRIGPPKPRGKRGSRSAARNDATPRTAIVRK